MDNKIIAQIIVSIVIAVISFLLYLLVAKLIKKVFKIKTKIPKKKQNTLMNFFINVARFLFVIIAIIMILEVFGFDTKTFLASLGVVTVVIGLAFQDILKDFIAGVSLIFENSYNVGDWVTINGFKGEVISMGVKTTRLKSFSGEVLIINNGSITQIVNHNAANATAVVDVNVAYESDIEKVEKILIKLCEKLSKQLPNLKGELTMLGIESLGDSAITFRVTVEVEAGTQFTIQREIRKQVKLELDKNNITIPYNQLVVHNE